MEMNQMKADLLEMKNTVEQITNERMQKKESEN